jgi:hypothetical protein
MTGGGAGIGGYRETMVELDRRLPIAQASKPTGPPRAARGYPPRGIKSFRANPKL